MKWIFIALCSTALFFCAICIEVNKCKEDLPGPIDFVSKGCDKLPCPLIKGTMSDANVTFRVPYDVINSTVKIEAKVGILPWVGYPPPDSNTCHNLVNSYCPLDENEQVTYHLGIPVYASYPEISMKLKVQFLDENENSMMCLEVPCEVVTGN